MAKIGIMSFAHMHAYSYAQCLKNIAGAAFPAVWDDNAARGKKAAKQFGAKFIGDMDAFLGSGLDGVIVTSENMKHRAMVEKAAAAGLWILCEKPLAPSVDDAKAMVSVCKKARVGLGTAFPCRYVSAMKNAHDRIQAGEFGDILAASCTNHGMFPGGWFADDSLSGGGATMDHTVHVVDALRWILGREFTKAYCELGNQFHAGSIQTDDLGSVHLEMEGGIQVQHLASWSRPKSFPTWGDVTIEFIGTKGVLNIDAFNQKLNVYSDAAMKAEWAFWGDNPDMGLVSDFVASVDARREPSVTGLDGLRAVQVTAAAYKSVQTGRMIKV